MKKNNATLSVYIPTYNRKDRLFELLNSIAAIKTTTGNISFEVVVCDNASTDGTQNLAHQAVSNNIIDTYIRRRINEGADSNILDCFKFTTGDFVWVLCDDDIPRPDSIANIQRVISEHGNSVNLIYVNRRCEWMDGSVQKERGSDCKEGIEKNIEKLIVSPGTDLLTASTLVLKRQVQPMTYVQDFGMGNFVSPLCMALDAISSGPAYLFAEPQLIYREGDKSGWIAEWPKIWKVNVPTLLQKFLKDHQLAENLVDWSVFQ